jgi:hypothetical protein
VRFNTDSHTDVQQRHKNKFSNNKNTCVVAMWLYGLLLVDDFFFFIKNQKEEKERKDLAIASN